MGFIGDFSLMIVPYVIGIGLFAYVYGMIKKSDRWIETGRRATLALAFLTTAASLTLIYLLSIGDFRYEYVARYTSTDLSLFYKIAAFWGGNAGSLLLWLWLLSLYTALVTYSKHKDSEQMLPIVSTVLLSIGLFFAIVLETAAPPFKLAANVVTEGSGLNPLLQNPGMAVHPVTLYLGYIGFGIPFAYAVAALILKKTDAVWLKVTRKWTLISWFFLTMGIIYGAKWSYVELGWGGYWAWDPVENASFMPWLTGTAFLHSAMIQEKKGMMKKWNVSLIILTFLLTLFGTFLTRSGILWSVHAFANGPLGAYFLAFIGIALVFCVGLLVVRWPSLKGEVEFEAAVSKETSFMLNNLLLLGVAFTVFWGTIYPVISEALTGDKVMVGAPFFNRVSLPVFILLVVLMGICPLIAWKKSTLRNLRKNFLYPLIFAVISAVFLFLLGVRGLFTLLSLTSALFVVATISFEFYRGVEARAQMTGQNKFISFFQVINRNRRRYGGYMIHLAVVFIAIGVTMSSAYSSQIQVMLKPDERVNMKQYTLTYRGLSEEKSAGKSTVFADVVLQKGDKTIGVVRPERIFYANGLQPTSEIAIYSTWSEDIYVVLAGWEEGTSNAVFEIHWNPLIQWIWFGGYLIILGTLIALWPDRRRDVMIE
ncbi:heme lyase CcmF/NrfE family subunit [Microaerobacter geothermalis]|uniref:heme lyase CcmF/NrfE family subunit n=1 Tax=Microaerobacter geothermalis TaxID=674972 RepID=UPI001F354BE1|nr:heme lyase CcmF/NrfE family subunit [Microaerobacter geothermalis]MCF6092542.1 heme lyase CcmF/NrfE family subunit [Microaerobacter geothermalis]